jgi:hypothetical protein
MSTYHQFFQSSFHHSYPNFFLPITNRKQRILTPYSKLRRAYTWTSLRKLIRDNGSSRAPCCPPNARETEGVAWSQKWLPYHLPEGYSGVTGIRGQGQNKSNRKLGNSPRRWRRARAYIDITHTLELEHNSLSLAQHFLFETLFTRSRANILLWPNIAIFFLSVQRSIVRIFLFLFTNVIIYIEIWQLLITETGFSFVNHRKKLDQKWLTSHR